MSPTSSSPTHAKGEEAVSSKDNKALVRRFVDEVQSTGNIDLIDEVCSPGFVNHSAPPGIPADREGLKILTAMFRGAFPDSHFTIEDMVAEGDKVATRKTFHGTHGGDFMGMPPPARVARGGQVAPRKAFHGPHGGDFMGMPPTGRVVSMGLIDIVRVSVGRVVEHWAMGDSLGMMQQLGVIPQ